MKSILKPFVLFPVILIFFATVSCKKKDTSAEEFSFAFLTDIHVQPEKNAAEGFRKAIDRVNRLQPDFVITGGDMIMDALNQRESRVDSLYSLYDSLSALIQVPVYNTIGNHEIFGYHPKSGIDPSHPLYGKKMYEQRIGKRFYAFDHKGWRFYILDSIEKDHEGVYIGKVDSVQLEWLERDLGGVNPSTPIVVVMHIPLITVRTQLLAGSTVPNGESLVVVNSKEVLDRFADHNLKLVLQGHLHFLEEISAMGARFITGGAVCASWWNGPRLGMEEGFVMIHVKGNKFNWEYVDYGWEVPQQESDS